MKHLLWIFLLLSPAFVFAQKVYNSSGKAAGTKHKKEKGYDPANLVLGGGLNFGYSGDYANIGISPKVGYKVLPFLAVGVGLGYQFYKAPDFEFSGKPYYIHQHIIFPAIWAKANVYKQFYIAADAEYDFIIQRSNRVKYVNGVPDHVEKVRLTADAPCMLLGMGIKQSLGGRTTAVFEVMYDALQATYSPYKNTLVYRAGIFVGL